MIRLTAVGNNLFFGLGTETLGTELGMSDGTAAGTGLVKDINPGELGSGPNYLVDIGGMLVVWPLVSS
jgi:ELWxxDGT repeat protein